MRTFNYEKLENMKWDMDLMTLVAKIHECKGRQELFIRQKPVELKRLIDVAVIQSTESSNRIEGIITTDIRMKQLLSEKTQPRNRDESEIIGYRNVLSLIHENHALITINANYILQLHRDLLKNTGLSYAGKFKNVQNFIYEIHPDGTSVTRFIPVAPYDTPRAVESACESYRHTIAMEKVEPLLLIPVFILDFLCIHPFNDGNGRMSRLLTLLLLYQNGYEVGKYISLEKKIEDTKDRYYDVLQASDINWDIEENDPTPFIRYMLQTILACYLDFEERVGLVNAEGEKSTAYDIVSTYVKGIIGRFTSSDVVANCPSISRSSVLSTLKRLTQEGVVERHGKGKSTYYLYRND